MNQNVLRGGLASILLLFTVFMSAAAFAQATSDAEMDALIAHLSKSQPQIAQQYEAEKKTFEKWEKDLGKTADGLTQSHMDKVFGKDKLKSSDILSYLKASEAALAGDFEKAGATLTDTLATCPPNLFGCYMKAWKEARTQIATQINRWEEEIYGTQSFKFMRYDLAHLTEFEEMTKEYPQYQAYVPSYMVSYLTNDPAIGDEMKALYAAMVERENLIFKTWYGAGGRVVSNTPAEKKFNSTMSRADAYGVLMWGQAWMDGHQSKPWWQFSSTGDNTAKWRSRLGFAPGDRNNQSAERAIFNHFLYILTSAQREHYNQELLVYYVEPLIEKEARKQTRLQHQSIAEALQKAMTEMRIASGEAAFKAQEAAYRKHLDDGLADSTILLPADVQPATAHAMGMQAVTGKGSYYDVIASLHARGAEEAKAAAAQAEAMKAKALPPPDPIEEPIEELVDEVPETIDVSPKATPEAAPPASGIPHTDKPAPLESIAPPKPSIVGPSLRNCLMRYDFSGHENADLLALLPEYLEADAKGYLTTKNDGESNLLYLLDVAGDVCNGGQSAAPPPEPEEPTETLLDEWDDADDIDDIIVSSLSEAEQWAKRDELAAKAEQDAARSEARFNRQYASAEMQRAEEERIKRQKAAERAEAFAAISQGLSDISAQMQQSRQQDRAAAQRNAQAYDTTKIQQQSNARSSFVNACVSERASNSGFRSTDPTGDRLVCSQKYDARKNGTYGNGDTYAEKLERQQQQTAQRRASGERQRTREGRDRSTSNRQQADAKARCACYEAGKRAGAMVPQDQDLFSHSRAERPENCRASTGMGNTQPWRLGLFDGWRRKTDEKVKEICKFGS